MASPRPAFSFDRNAEAGRLREASCTLQADIESCEVEAQCETERQQREALHMAKEDGEATIGQDLAEIGKSLQQVSAVIDLRRDLLLEAMTVKADFQSARQFLLFDAPEDFWSNETP